MAIPWSFLGKSLAQGVSHRRARRRPAAARAFVLAYICSKSDPYVSTTLRRFSFRLGVSMPLSVVKSVGDEREVPDRLEALELGRRASRSPP